jgi:hypothetical protein
MDATGSFSIHMTICTVKEEKEVFVAAYLGKPPGTLNRLMSL